jgi:Tc toxin complex TcA C-terminal TcB-binding domain/Protein of unknown function (DUF2934)
MSSYIVIRLIPDSPVDGATFATYLDGLRLQVFDAYTKAPLSDFVYSSPLVLTQWPGVNGWLSLVSVTTSASTPYNGSNYGTILSFDSTDGIPEGSFVFSADQKTIPPSSSLAVSQVDGNFSAQPNTIQLSGGTLGTYVPAGTVVTFISQYSGNDPTAPAPVSFPLPTNAAPATIDGQPATTQDPLVVLSFANTSGITVGMAVSGSASIPANTTVAEVASNNTTVILSQGLTGALPSGTSVTFTLNPPFASYTLKPTSGTPAANPTKLKFPSGGTQGIAVGMTLAPSSLVAPGTSVLEVTSTTVTLSKALLGALPSGQTLVFVFPLGSGIVQHTEVTGVTFGFFGMNVTIGPASVATAVIPLFTSPTLPNYLDITVTATRDSEVIPDDTKFYNVLVSISALPTTPDQYPEIATSDTSLYIELPPLAGANTIPLIIPSNGSAPLFDTLYAAMQTALANDRIAEGDTSAQIDALIPTLITSPADCTRIAYDIVWSYQNALPPPPDPLESLYTNPPNPGGTADGSSSGDNNLEQDRQKFEGTLNSFYATRNANAERLAKFVAAVSAAIVCEQASLNATSALLEFPVDPASAYAIAVESELLLQGVNLDGIAGVNINFGVPAAYFYALAANLDKSTNALQRYQHATGDAIERLLQQFSAAEDANVLNSADSETFKTNSTLAPITSFQAARRLVALGVSTASTSPSVTVFAALPLATLVQDWLATIDPTPDPPPNPPLTYQNTDFNIWTQTLEKTTPQGYLYLDLDTLTQGFVIPSSTVSPSAATSSGPTLTFDSTQTDGSVLGVGVGMLVTGTNIAPNTTVSAVARTMTVTLNTPLTGAGVSTGDTITFTAGSLTITANPISNAPSGSVLTFAWTIAISAVAAGMSVAGTGITPGTTVSASASTTTVTLSASVLAAVPTSDDITFNPTAATPPVEATTTADCASGTDTLTFGGPGTTTGILKGMTVYGPNIPPAAVVSSVASPTVTIAPAVTGDLPASSVVSFAMLPPANTLADQIAAWLPSTTSPPTPNPTVETLKQVTAAQWTSFFTFPGNPAWLPPFTQPVVPGAGQVQSSQKAGYILQRVKAFIRAVQQFFTVSSVATSSQLPAPGAPSTFNLPAFDPIGLGAAGLSFSTPLTTAELTAAEQSVFPTDLAAQAWLAQAMTSINDLWQIASVVKNPTLTPGYTLPASIDVSFSFSIAEALYARGFRTANDIASLSPADFQQALTGTVAYDFAIANSGGGNSLYQQAQSLATVTTPSSGQGSSTFQPINPDGSLVNCLPPPCLSPLGPIAYLQEMLNLSQASTCDDPSAPPAAEQITLGAAVAARRGPLGTLLATCANLETPLPLVDIVNECLEFLGATQPPSGGASSPLPSGTVYNTSADQLAGYPLCQENDCPDQQERGCHQPAAIFAALPEYSTPATPVTGINDSVEPLVYNNLKTDFSSCHLPYSQPLDVSRTYLRYFGSCRFELLRTFRKCISEFALDPATPPTGFQSFLWRYPVRIETAIEYLGITPEEYTTLFQGTPPQACATIIGNAPPTTTQGTPSTNVPGTQSTALSTTVSVSELYGFPPANQDERNIAWTEQVLVLSEFLQRTCLTYCEFLELWKAVFLHSTNQKDPVNDSPAYPECEPCCLKDYKLQLPDGANAEQFLLQLALFIRLWRKLKDVCGARYTFVQLYDIATVLNLYQGGAINPEFIRQLAAFQMLRDHFNLPLFDPSDKATGTTGADRTHLLALWVGSGAAHWNWAVARLLDGVESHSKIKFGCERPRGEGIAHMADNLDALSRLAGFNPPTATNPSTDTWNSTPGCTLRFAEVLAKICASTFRIDDLLYLFNAIPPQDCNDPFPPQDPEDALHYPLDLPETQHDHSLWRLREALLQVEVSEKDAHHWTWPRVVAEFREKFGYLATSGQDPLLSLGQHFFPDVLRSSGYIVTETQRQYRTPLTLSSTWNTPAGTPFQYDASATELWMQLPLRDESVAEQLSQLPALNAAEQAALQDLYFAPRLDLAAFAFLFPDWQSAEIHLIQECEEHERWRYFQHHFALANARRKVIARHLAQHVEHHAHCHNDHLQDVAELVLSQLLSDENTGTPWESDAGTPPSVLWPTQPAGGAIAALLGLIGTGLLGEYQAPTSQTPSAPTTNPSATNSSAAAKNPNPPATNPIPPSNQILWREVRGPMEAFGHERDHTNSPVPTILPSLTLSPTASAQVAYNNGYAIKNSDGQSLGGAEPIQVRWSGVLLVEREGEYAFHAGTPTPEGERPDPRRAEMSQWRVTLQRGQKSWLVLNHHWPGETDPERNMPRLRRGAHSIVVEYTQPAPAFNAPIHPQRTGFEVKYRGPDTEDCLIALPVKHLYRDFQDQTLDQGITFLAGSKNAQAFLKAFYTSTLRDMRRSYQRAYKAVLFTGRLHLSSRPDGEDRLSELGYLLANSSTFAGSSFYRPTSSSTTFVQHLANFDLNFLPLRDNYHPSPLTPGDRSDPSLQQTQAMFDWWERLFDYDRIRSEVRRDHEGQVWQLFDAALVKNPTNAAVLLRYIGADPAQSAIDLRFFQDQASPIYTVSSTDLEDERWLKRVWQADRWIRALQDHFHGKDLSQARPDLWASSDPSAPLPASGVSETGNANLLQFLADGCIEDGDPRRYLDLARLNDGLRDRGRHALVAYLCHENRVVLPGTTSSFAATAKDLSDLLLLDVEAGLCERASRIDEAISAVQAFVRRSQLGLEPAWTVTRPFMHLWDSRFETYRTWERCKRKEIYRENWIEWEEFGKARRIEAFRFLESELRSSALTLAAPGGLDWWQDDDKSLQHEPTLIQRSIPSELTALTVPPQSTTREGLATLGSPEYPAEPTWLAAVPQTATQTGAGSGATAGVPSSSTGTATNTPAATAAGSAQSLAQSVVVSSTQPQALPFWMQSAMKLGTRFLRVAAAGVPEAALGFVPHEEDPRSACCRQCGHHHPVLVDEYYFWLVNTQFYSYTDDTDAQSNSDVTFSGSYQLGFQDSYYDPFQQQSAEWNEEDLVPSLLAKWQSGPAVRLAWCRVHNGEFGQPRKSEGYVALADKADLTLLGRAADSLYFQVSGSAPMPPGYTGDTSPPGFRYDLPCDEAVTLPQVLAPPAAVTPSPYPDGLPCYPFFAYHQPGARLFPASWFAPALLVGDALRTHCRFELALRWYKRAFDPLNQDCAWMHCADNTSAPPTRDQIARQAYQIWEQHGRPQAEQAEDWVEAEAELGTDQPNGGPTDRQGSQSGACCDSTKVSEHATRNRALTLQYCRTLVDWGDALMRRHRCPEAFEQARLLFDTAARITGRRPQTLWMSDPSTPSPISTFVPAYPPLNPRLLDLYSLVDDRLSLVRDCLDARRLRNGRLDIDMSYFGDSPFRDGWRTVPESCADQGEWCWRHSPYRFTAQIQKAIELAGKVRELGSALLSAYEKGDAERLASIRAEQERELLAMTISIRQDQWRDADWQVQALQQTKDMNQTNLLYYTNLYQNGLINNEIQNLSLATNAMQTKTSANITEAIGEAMKIVPDFFVGAMSTFSQIPIGTKLAGLFETIGKVMMTIAEIQSATAAIDATEASWQRRSDEWFHQMQVLPIEIRQTELQILGAQRRRDQAMQELNNQQRQVEHSTEVLDFLRDKFTASDLYLWMQKETSALQSQMFKLAHHAALEAQRAFNFERGHTTRRFLPEETWDDLYQGLLAGERLEFALRHMEKSYLDENIREYELTKHFSLRLHFPIEFLRLKATGRCEIELPEWMFDLDYPGQYMRRIKNISLTIPCVTGPYTGVHCRMTLLSSITRIDPRVDPPATHCCCECGANDGYDACLHDPRVVRAYAAKEAIATSSGQNDSGLFELNFRDERYLPFEFHGAVSRWRIELPPENNCFPMETLTDLVVHLNHTAWEGGDRMRRAASNAAQQHLPGSGWCFFDVRHEFPDAWQLLQNSTHDDHASSSLNLRLDRKMFPCIPGAADLSITSMAILFHAANPGDCNCPEPNDCPCPGEEKAAARILEFRHGHQPHGEDASPVTCLATAEWPNLYYGVFDTHLGPLGRDKPCVDAQFRFPPTTGHVEQVFLLCRYQRVPTCCSNPQHADSVLTKRREDREPALRA